MLPFAHLDDDELRLALFEMSNGGSIRFDPDKLASLSSILYYANPSKTLVCVKTMIPMLIFI